jgi:hypothetical protein
VGPSVGGSAILIDPAPEAEPDDVNPRASLPQRLRGFPQIPAAALDAVGDEDYGPLAPTRLREYARGVCPFGARSATARAICSRFALPSPSENGTRSSESVQSRASRAFRCP